MLPHQIWQEHPQNTHKINLPTQSLCKCVLFVALIDIVIISKLCQEHFLPKHMPYTLISSRINWEFLVVLIDIVIALFTYAQALQNEF